jgi:hypothetical protein
MFLAFQMDQQMAARAPSYIYAPHEEGLNRSKTNIVHNVLAERFDGSIMQLPPKQLFSWGNQIGDGL